MNNLLFTALLIALLYYFFYYLPSQKKLNATNLPSKHNQSTQTETIKESNSTNTLNCPGPEFDLQEIDNLKTQITNLQTQIRELVKRPLKPTNSKSIQTDNKDLENTLDTLIKGIQELNNEL